MPAPSPQTKANQIIEKMQLLEAQKEAALPLVLAGIKREIDSILKIDAASHYMLLGMFRYIKGEFGEAIAAHEKSIQLASTSFNCLINFAITLRKTGNYARALKILDRASMISPATHELVSEAFLPNLISGQWDAMDKIISRYTRATGKAEDQSMPAAHFRQLQRNFINLGIDQAVLEKTGAIAERLMNEYGVSVLNASVSLHKLTDTPYAALDLHVPLSGDRLAALNHAFMERFFADESLSHAWGKLIYNFSRSA